MISKVIFFAALSSIAAASVIPVLHHAPQPYKFGYDIKDKHGEQYRQEEGNGGQVVKGSYVFTDARGIKRQVDYLADHAGFRAQVKTNEPGTANQNPAAVQMISAAPYAGGVALGGAAVNGFGFGDSELGGVARANYGPAGAAIRGYEVGRNGLGYGVIAPGYAAGVELQGLGYGLGGLGYAGY